VMDTGDGSSRSGAAHSAAHARVKHKRSFTRSIVRAAAANFDSLAILCGSRVGRVWVANLTNGRVTRASPLRDPAVLATGATMPTRRFPASRIARFGDFELDLRAAELRCAGVRARLQEQPFRILAMLLEHPGEVVLRDEIRKRLWPDGTVVEVGHGINAAVLRLREALGESAENPRFIETLPRRGYRFNGQVHWEQGPATTLAGAPPASSSRPAAEEWTGRTISHYRVIEKLGSGGMGVVYRAEDLQLGREVALKFLAREYAQDASARERFQREARAASALNHPNVCTVYGVEEFGGQPVISMELVEGETLSCLLAKGPLPQAQTRSLALQALAALEAAHRKGVVHRDLKPGNLMVTSCGLKVLDFGIAKMGRASVTEKGDVLGTPDYMSPEQVRGAPTDARSDIYSFGLVLYEMLTGRRYSRESQVPLPGGWERVIARCLAHDAQARWQTAADLKTELERTHAAPPAPPRRARSWWRIAAVPAAIACFVAIVKFAPWPGDPAPSQFVLSGPEGSKALRVKVSPDGRAVAFVSGTHLYVRASTAPRRSRCTRPMGSPRRSGRRTDGRSRPPSAVNWSGWG
jgi:DNA-binding winged helix-turn-helix (wHTH) protein